MPSNTPQLEPHGVRCPVTLPRGLPEHGTDVHGLIRVLYMADLRWELGGRGPQAFDCYSLTQLVQWHLFGRAMLSVELGADASRRAIVLAMRHHTAHIQWRPVSDTPLHGDGVHMAHRDDPWHVGTFLAIDRGVVVHCSERQGLRVDPLTDLRASGWTGLQFFRFEGACL